MRYRPAIVIFSAATLQGFAFTLVPALATVFSSAPYRIDASAFGGLFVTLTVGAVAAAAFTPLLARAYGTIDVLRFGMAANVLALAALLGSPFLHGGAYALLLADTLLLGVGFGLNVSAINELAAMLSTDATRSITIANVLIGLGTALTPLFIGTLVTHGSWPAWPAFLIVAFAGVLAFSLGWRSQRAPAESTTSARGVPAPLVLFGLATLLYAFCEGAFSSWATTFAHTDRGFSLETGESALSAFWFALTGARTIAALLPSGALPPKRAFVLFPLAIAVAFVALPFWSNPAALVFGFVLGGVACSIVYPYAMSLSLAAMPGSEDRTASVMVGALMSGEGLGTYVMGVLRTNAGVTLPEIYTISAIIAVVVAIVAGFAVRTSARAESRAR